LTFFILYLKVYRNFDSFTKYLFGTAFDTLKRAFIFQNAVSPKS